MPERCEPNRCEFIESESAWRERAVVEGQSGGFDCSVQTPEAVKACSVRDWTSCASHSFSGSDCMTFGQVYCQELVLCKERGYCTHYAEKRGERVFQGCKIASDGDCARSERCLTEGACGFVPARGCLPTSSDHCAKSLDCEERGLCHFTDNRCLATPESCASSRGCKEEGRCLSVSVGVDGSACIKPPDVPYDAICLDECIEFGRCKHTGGGRCVIENNEQCAQSKACSERGQCVLVERKSSGMSYYSVCRATRQNHCEESGECETFGRCSLYEGFCVGDESGCRGAVVCKRDGKCSPAASKGPCVVRSESDCEASLGCNESGECAFDPARGTCTGRDQPADVLCAMSTMCEQLGRCTFSQESSSCVVPDLAYCEAIFDVCKQRLRDGSPMCKIENGDCVLSPKVCRSPVYCKGPGAVCKPRDLIPKEQTEFCKVVSLDCSKTEACQKTGACLAQDGVCLAGKEACESSPRCKSDGLCEFDSSTYECKGHRDAYCREQSACKEEGRCSSVVDYDTDETSCGAKLDRDCEASSLCKDDGKCKAWRGSCVSEDAIAESDGDCADGQVRIDGGCRYPTGTSCKKTEFCKERGQCKASKPMRVCSDDGVCSKQKYVQCEVPAGSSCVGASACSTAYPDRWASHMTCDAFDTPCEKPGDCVVSRTGWGSTSHCSFAELSMGTCQPASVCVLTDRWCRRQPSCKERGECELVSNGTKGGDWLECRATEESHCAKSDACRERGDCALTLVSVLYDCGPTKQEHCQKSALCKEENRCTFDGAGCSF